MANRFTAFVNKGVSSITTAYNQQLKAAEQRASKRAKVAASKVAKEKVRADLQHEKLVLERDMYEAKARVRADKEAVKAARKRAGVVTWGDRLDRLGQSVGKELGKAMRGSTRSSRPRRRVVKSSAKSRLKARRK